MLCDGTNIVVRCASVLTDRPETAPDDVIVTAGRMIRRAAESLVEATHLIVAFDVPDATGHSFRHELYPQYKAHRAHKSGETRAWVTAARESFASAGVCCVAAPGFEADDVIATLAVRASANPTCEVHILSGDSDLLALASDRVHCWSFGRKDQHEAPILERTADWIATKYGIPSPAHLTLYKTLVGDTSDGIPGVRGVGKVRARALIAEYGSLEQMIAYGMLRDHAAWAMTAREFVALRTDVPLLPISPSTCRLTRRSHAA